MLNNMVRAQAAWGTMEVLIAVIILGFSMAIVFYMMNQVQTTQCVSTLKAQSTSLENAMVDVALGAPPTQREVQYPFTSCGSMRVSAMRFVYFKQPQLCGRCSGYYNGCWMIIPTYYDSKTNSLFDVTDASVCVNMPANIGLKLISNTLTLGSTTYQCLGDNAHVSDTPCTAQDASGNAVSAADCARFSNVPRNVFDTQLAQTSSQGCNDNGEQSCWHTFGTANGDLGSMLFIISKDPNPSSADSSGIIDICPARAR